MGVGFYLFILGSILEVPFLQSIYSLGQVCDLIVKLSYMRAKSDTYSCLGGENGVKKNQLYFKMQEIWTILRMSFLIVTGAYERQ